MRHPGVSKHQKMRCHEVRSKMDMVVVAPALTFSFFFRGGGVISLVHLEQGMFWATFMLPAFLQVVHHIESLGCSKSRKKKEHRKRKEFYMQRHLEESISKVSLYPCRKTRIGCARPIGFR